jgi:hypothetical protein
MQLKVLELLHWDINKLILIQILIIMIEIKLNVIYLFVVYLYKYNLNNYLTIILIYIGFLLLEN